MLIVCKKCTTPIFKKSGDWYCYVCRKKRKEDDFHQDDFPKFMEDIWAQEEFGGEDIENLVHVLDYMVSLNTTIAIELGKALKQNDHLKTQLSWYRKNILGGD